MHHGVTFNFGSAIVCSPAIFETSFSYDKDLWLTTTDYYMYFYIIICAISSYTPINKCFCFIVFSLLIDAVISEILHVN